MSGGLAGIRLCQVRVLSKANHEEEKTMKENQNNPAF